ncbi:MAG TPA: tetratricopeptide repeat protein [Longimicrobium sp.]|nr:tetratricopeptide repeat protein [Longimicrobium sp.]
MKKRTTMAVVAAGVCIPLAAWLALGRGGSEPLLIATAVAQPLDLEVRNRDIEFFEARAKADPYSGSDRGRLAYLYLQRGRETGEYEDYRRAETAARASLAARTHRNEGAYLTLASSQLAQHHFADALQAARELVAMAPDQPSYLALLGELQLEMGDYVGARATFGALEPARANLAVAPRLARWDELNGRTVQARNTLVRAARDADSRGDLPREQAAWFHLRVADLESRSGRLDAAEREFAAGLRANPGDARMYAGLARVEWLRGEWERALAYGEAAGDRADISTLAVMGDAAAELGRAADAEAWYGKAEASAAATPEPYNRQWTAFRLDHGRHLAETRALLEREIAGRKDVLGYDMLAWARFRVGDVAGARVAMGRALAMGTPDPTFHFHAGMIERAAGNPAGAREHLEKALDINPRFHPRFAAVARAVLNDRPLPESW